MEKVLLARVGRKDSRSIETYIEDGGYKALRTVLTGGWTPEKLTDEVKKSGLRGRGGGVSSRRTPRENPSISS
jgi:NADH-quinone oxidoreductase subunit F